MENEMLFFELSTDELTILAVLVALGFSKGLNINQINVLGNFLAAVGTLMTMIVAQEQALTSLQQEKQADDVQNQIKELEQQIQQILNK
ncbi:hypothetical protein [Sporomusa acidovorans]|uniref:hypothetical protein n=1 Tax=Sporomusa acidovorans TaxID=112900 RepID=UPI00088028B7|nr:hypothetical protein [Sporomusa acidovorans]OZC19061.1 hypothetical protein SPACI_31470 [Sporomusa acidovorans DSM 3132]SDD66085.1 hypothetical protein SAMN04488499_10037 [Sporomusa acidovorans]